MLLIDVGPVQAVIVFIVALVAMLVFAAGTMGWFVTRSRLWESTALVIIALTLFRPGFWLDQVQPPYENVPPEQIFAMAEAAAPDGELRVGLEGMTLDGDFVSSTYLLPLGKVGPDGATRLEQSAGLTLAEREGQIVVDLITFGGKAEGMGIDFDWTVTRVEVEADRIPKELFYIPALLLLGLIALVQRSRVSRDPKKLAA